MKAEYVKIIENDPMKKARLVTLRKSENEYDIVEFDIPKQTLLKIDRKICKN